METKRDVLKDDESKVAYKDREAQYFIQVLDTAKRALKLAQVERTKHAASKELWTTNDFCGHIRIILTQAENKLKDVDQRVEAASASVESA